jgi:hypothetical protein
LVIQVLRDHKEPKDIQELKELLVTQVLRDHKEPKDIRGLKDPQDRMVI